jgi:hypothetical protein
MLPAVGASSPAIRRSSVLLPQPLRPTIATNWPAADGQRQAARRGFGRSPQLPRLHDNVGAVDRLAVHRLETKRFLHSHSHFFWKAGCHDKVSRSSAREALSASLPSKA